MGRVVIGPAGSCHCGVVKVLERPAVFVSEFLKAADPGQRAAGCF
jgi:hypothetical protein